MATPPFNIAEGLPGDSDIVAQYPAIERAFRDIVEDSLAVEHDYNTANSTARHRFGVGDNTARDAIMNWPVGAIWFNTTTTPAQLQRVVSVGPVVWENVGPGLASSNLFTAKQTFQLAVADSNIVLETLDPGTAGASMQFYHHGNSQADNDVIALVRFSGQDDANVQSNYAAITASAVDVSAATEDGRISFYSEVNGVEDVEQLRVESGVYTPGATGGGKGLDSINAVALYANGARVANTSANLAGTAASPGVNDHGTTYIGKGAGYTLTLPLISTVFDGYSVSLMNQCSSGTCAANRNGAPDVISSKGVDINSITLPSKSDVVTFYADVTANRWFVRGTRTYQSANQAITASGQLVLAHGFGVQPVQLTTWIKNISGVTKNGYPANDEILVPAYPGDVQAATNRGCVVQADATNINVAFNSAATTFTLVPKTGAAATNLVNADWNLIVRATVLN